MHRVEEMRLGAGRNPLTPVPPYLPVGLLSGFTWTASEASPVLDITSGDIQSTSDIKHHNCHKALPMCLHSGRTTGKRSEKLQQDTAPVLLTSELQRPAALSGASVFLAQSPGPP